MTPIEEVEFAAYQLKLFAQVCFNQWKEERAADAGPPDWEYVQGFFAWYKMGGVTLIHPCSSRKYECGGVCFEVHTIVLI